MTQPSPSQAQATPHPLAAWSLWFASLALGVMAVVAFADVVLRVAGRPITGAYELTSLLVALVVYAGLPDVTWRDEHVSAGLFATWMAKRPTLNAALGVFRRICTTLVMVLLAVAMTNYALRLASVGDRAPFIELPLAWVAGIGASVLGLSAWLALRARYTAKATEGDLKP
jgi:TRAP-type transport system small permease protein